MSDDIFGRIAKAGEGMSTPAIPPLTIYCKNKSLWEEETVTRAKIGSIVDRTIGAVFMAARLAKTEVFFVGRGARARFNLTPDQLRKGLDRLEQRGAILTVAKRKGRYRRIQLVQVA